MNVSREHGISIVRFIALLIGLILILKGVEKSLDLEDYLGIILVSAGLAL